MKLKHLKFQPKTDPSMAEIKNYPQAAFTLIEMLVVVFVLGIGIVGALSFFNININNQFEAKNELVAASLAQEGADLMRNKVDYAKLNGTSWSSITSAFTACTRIDYASLGGTHPCNNGTNNYLCFSGGRYQQCASGTGTGIKRDLTIVYDSSDKSLHIRVDVKWNSDSRATTANDIIYENAY